MKNVNEDGKKGLVYLRLTTDLAEYKSFFETAWAKQRAADCEPNKDLTDVFFELIYAWRTLSASFRFPSLIAPLTKRFADSFTAEEVKARSGLVGALRLRLADRLSKLGRSNDLALFVELIADAEHDIVMAIPEIQHCVTAQEIWESYVREPQFQITLAGLPQQTFAGLYFAFETFLLRALHLKSPATVGTTTIDQGFIKAFRSAFGEPLTNDCWTGPHAVMVREMRHAIVHNGARMTPALKNYRSRLPIDNGKLFIVAEHVSKLYRELKPKVDRLLAEFVPLT